MGPLSLALPSAVQGYHGEYENVKEYYLPELICIHHAWYPSPTQPCNCTWCILLGGKRGMSLATLI